jgi:uncharacterized protein (TIGR04255 family)
MPFPESPRVVFNRNVLVDVVCQLRFPPILAITAEDPAAFQNRIRATYPEYRQDQAIDVPPPLREVFGRLNLSRGTELLRHTFLTPDSSRSVFLTRDFLAVEDTHYHRWEEFEPEVQRAKTAFEEIYRPASYNRVGLRYQDIIDRMQLPGLEDVPWHELINPALIGALGSSELRDSVTEIVTNSLLSVSEVPGAFVRLHHGLRRQEGTGTEVYFFDVDFFLQERSSSQDAMATLGLFNRLSGNLFRWAISRRLYDALDPVPI